jgi:Spy/CpxP family protein refolding chaperone
MRQRKKSILFIIALLGLALPVRAQQMVTVSGPGKHYMFYLSTGGGFAPPPPVIIPPLMLGLQAAHLTADQQNHVDQILQSNRAQTAPLIEQLGTVHEQIADKLLAAGKITEADLLPLENQAAQLDAQIQQQALNASVQIRAILTPEQISRMAQFHQKMAALQTQMKNLMAEASGPGPEPGR